MPCSCMATTFTLIFCLKGLSLQFLRRAATIAGCKMYHVYHELRRGQKKVACVCPDPPTLHLCPMQLQAVFVVHTRSGVCLLFDYHRLSREAWGHLRHTSVGSSSC